MHRFAALATAVFVFSVTSCDDRLRNEWLLHVKQVAPRHFPCRIPQSRVVGVKELVDEKTWLEIQYFQIMPHRTVLKKCFSAGSCTKNHSCQPDEIQEVNLIFGYLIDNRRIKYLNVTADNHVSCSCQRDTSTPK